VQRPDALKALAAGAAVVTITLTAAAFWLSYEHLHDIAGGNGLDGARAWAWPATVDLFIVAGELLILRASLRRSIDPWAIALAATGSLGSIALNVAGVGADAHLLEYIVAAVPPVAALLAFGALMRQVHDALARVPAPALTDAQLDAAVSVTFDRVAAEAVQVATEQPPAPALPPLPETFAPAFAAARHRSAVHQLITPDADAEMLEAALQVNATALAETGRPASLRRLQAGLGVGQKRAQRIQQQLAEGA
jgi:hypothetical protein